MKRLGLVVVTLFCLKAFPCDIHGITGFLPENTLWISEDSFVDNDMTEEKFNEIIDRADKIYAPIVKEMSGGLPLKWQRKWSSGTVNAYAKQTKKEWIVAMFGGLARHSLVTPDGFAAVVCHELGHHIGGAPKKVFGSRWASNEGQSDYWATLKCLRKLFEEDDNIKITKSMTINKTAKAGCDEQFADAAEQALCYRLSMAGLSLGKTLGKLGRSRNEIKFTTPDTKVVSKTNDRHPAAQCRLDTYYAGALCTVDHNVDVDQKEANIGTCVRSESANIGVRPLCWYKPAE